jgi:hypothetical protein
MLVSFFQSVPLQSIPADVKACQRMRRNAYGIVAYSEETAKRGESGIWARDGTIVL